MGITESAYAENFDQLIATVNELRAYGFTVLMDDFGNEYSSLNMLSDIKLDILKIDMKFLDTSNHQNTRNSSILESITSMRHWLGLRMIAGGVEAHEQADRLLNLNCEYMQGYYFYKPISRSHFCELLADTGRIDIHGIQTKHLSSIDLEDLFHKDITNEAILSSILGGITLYEIEDDTYLQILMVNDRYYRITGCNAMDLQEHSKLTTRQIHPEDMPLVWDIFHEAQGAKSMETSGTFRRYRLNGELMQMHMQAFFLHRQGNRKLFYGSIGNMSITMSLRKELLAILQMMPRGIFEYQAYPDERLNCRIISAGLSLLHGYTTQELQDILKNGMPEYINERDHDEVMRIQSNPRQWKTGYNVEFRLFAETGETIWVEQHIHYIREEEGVRIYNSLLTGITKVKKQEDGLLESQHLLHHLLGIANRGDPPRQLTKRDKGHAAELYAESFPGGMIGGFCEKGFPLYFANEEMIHFLGYDNYQDLYRGVNRMVENTIYQEDRTQVELDFDTTFREGMEYITRYRMVQKDDSLIWDQDRGHVICEEQGRLAVINTCMNIDEIVKTHQLLQKARQNRQFLRQASDSGCYLLQVCKGFPLRHTNFSVSCILEQPSRLLYQEETVTDSYIGSDFLYICTCAGNMTTRQLKKTTETPSAIF